MQDETVGGAAFRMEEDSTQVLYNDHHTGDSKYTLAQLGLDPEAAKIEAERKARKEREEINKERIREKIDASIDLDQENPFRDSDGNRWIRCECCGRLSTEEDFVSYGGSHHANLGTCKECHRKPDASILPQYAVNSAPKIAPAAMKQDTTICPECGNKLTKRSGRYGDFLGCSSFPKCRYSKKI